MGVYFGAANTDVNALTSAFSTSDLVSSFTGAAPYILGVVGVLIGVGLAGWGVRTVRTKLSKPRM